MQYTESEPVANKPTSNQPIQERRQNKAFNALSYASTLNLNFAKAQGVLVRCADGRQYYDCLAAAGTLVLGHNHPDVQEGARNAMNAAPAEHRFVDNLLASLPEPLASRGRIQFCGSGSGADANAAAIKRVKAATGRYGMLSFHGSCRCISNDTLTPTNSAEPYEPATGLTDSIQFLPFPQSYRSPFGVAGHVATAHYVEHLISNPKSGVAPAGLILEIVQGEGGINPAPDNWLREIRRITRERNVPLIVDEVQTGWGRTGTLFAFMQSGIAPDVLVLSKTIDGDLPLSVVVYDQALDGKQPSVIDWFQPKQSALAAGNAALNYIIGNDIPSHAEKMGLRLASHLRQIQAEFPCIGDVRGRGLMLGVEFIDQESGKTWMGAPIPDAALARRVQQECLLHGLIIELDGRFRAVARFLPPLIVTAEDVDAIADLFAKAVRAAAIA